MTQRIVLTTLLLMALMGRPQAQIDLNPDSTTLGSPVNITNTFYNNGMQFPTADGQPGQVLTTNGSGQLSWQNAPAGGDLSTLYESLCNSPGIFQMGSNTFSTDTCGILYDSGGPNGNYGLNESFTFSLRPNLPGASTTLTRVILRNLDIEENQDTLFIEGTPYFSTLGSPDTLYFSDGKSVLVQFLSNSSNPGGPYEGFELYWEAIQYAGPESSSFIPGDFVFVPDRQSAHGGFHESAALQNLGEESLLLGYRGEASGPESSSVGYANDATGDGSYAFGAFNEATEFTTSAFGYGNDASGLISSAFGVSNEATGRESSAFGAFNEATEFASSAFGYFNDATELASSAFGYANEADGERSSAFGYFNNATGVRSAAFGHHTTANLYQMTTIGTYNQTVSGSTSAWVPTEPVFMVGNGENSSNPSTALTILKNGRTGIGTTAPTQTLSVNGSAGKPGGGAWSTFSDRRLKQNIHPYEDGLEQVLAIEPVFYQYTGKAELPTDREYVGIIAQDMQKVAPYMVEPLTYESETEQGTYLSYDGTALPYMLVNAIKELHEEIKEKNQRIADLEDRLTKIEALLTGQSEDETPVILNGDRASLEQNIPNPFRGVTRIGYFLPEGTQRATLLVHDMQGRELQRIPLQNTGRGQLDLQTRNLTAGTYSYSLYVDGALIDSRKMVVEQ